MTEEINKKNIYQLVNLPVKYIENEWPHAKLTRKTNWTQSTSSQT